MQRCVCLPVLSVTRLEKLVTLCSFYDTGGLSAVKPPCSCRRTCDMVTQQKGGTIAVFK